MRYKTKIFGNKISKNELIAISSQPQINLISIINDGYEDLSSKKFSSIKKESYLKADFEIDYLIICTNKINNLNKDTLKNTRYLIISNNFLNLHKEIAEKFEINNIYYVNFCNYIQSFLEKIQVILEKNNYSSFYLKSSQVNAYNLAQVINYNSQDYTFIKQKNGNFYLKIIKSSNKLLFEYIKSKYINIHNEKGDLLHSFKIDFNLIKKSYTNVFLDIIEEKQMPSISLI